MNFLLTNIKINLRKHRKKKMNNRILYDLEKLQDPTIQEGFKAILGARVS